MIHRPFLLLISLWSFGAEARRFRAISSQHFGGKSMASSISRRIHRRPESYLPVFTLRGGASKTTTTAAPIKIQEPTVTGDGTASTSALIFNLVKNIVGAGVLGLPAGIAAFGNAPSALLPFSALVVFIGLLSAYGFSLIGRVCAYTQARSYREAWERSVSKDSAWLPALCCLLATSCSVLAVSMILSDTLPQLLSALGVNLTRTQALLGITSCALLPLCLMKELKKLAPFSLIGIAGMFYTCIAMAIRYFGGGYKEGGKFMEDMPTNLQPAFGTNGARSVFTANAFILISMLSAAFMAHYSAPRFYHELENNTIKRFNNVVAVSFGISILIFSLISSLGFLTFGGASSGLILNHYSTKDPLMSLSRVAVAMSLLFSFPLAFVGVRDGTLDLLNVPAEKRSDSYLNRLTVLLLIGVTCLAYVVRDLRLLLAFGGATWSNAVIYLFPCAMMISCSKKMPQLESEVPIIKLTGMTGLIMGVIGTSRAVNSILSANKNL